MSALGWMNIVGHGTMIEALQGMVARGNVPHALLFVGPAGIGKQVAAQVTAAALLCVGDTVRPCGTCPSCRLNQRQVHPDLLRIGPDGAAIKIDQIRGLQHEAALAPVMGERRVCIINDAELMTTQAANSLLKLLEEPPPGFLFILVAQDSRPLLPTILSRCCRLRFSVLPGDLLIRTLREQGQEESAAAVAARLSGGRLGKALEILQPDGLMSRNQAMEWLVQISNEQGPLENKDTVNVEQLSSREAVPLLQRLLVLLRDLLLLCGKHDQQLIFNLDLVPRLTALMPRWTEPGLLAAMERVRATQRAVNGNANVRLSLEALWIRLDELVKRREEGDYGNIC
ncbi:MAG TPA: DNA polymerase III subunit delta' [Patescibacteria group bacterium]|nr:DNA polymerase III subunit delta' [Patescibacteria group bacterium]